MLFVGPVMMRDDLVNVRVAADFDKVLGLFNIHAIESFDNAKVIQFNNTYNLWCWDFELAAYVFQYLGAHLVSTT
jgi:hypothetical protein